MAMVGWSKKAREREEAFERWWAKATLEEKTEHRRAVAREERFLLRYFLPAWILLGILLVIAARLGWWR